MAKPLPKFLTRRQEAHKLIGWISRLQIRYDAWKDTRVVRKAQKQRRHH